MKKLLLLSLIFINFAYAAQKVLLVNRNIQFKEIISGEDVLERNTYKPLKRNCTPVTKDMIESTQYLALHYIRKGSIVCAKDVERYVRRSVNFNFGSFEVEKVGEVIQETKDFAHL